MTTVAPEAGRNQSNRGHQEIDEGLALRQYLKKNNLKQEDFARKVLEMSPQNLGHHMRKKRLTPDFKRLLKENGIHLFSENTFENHPKEKIAKTEGSIETVPFHIPIKDRRLVYFSLPKNWSKEDLELVIEYFKLMLKSMEK